MHRKYVNASVDLFWAKGGWWQIFGRTHHKCIPMNHTCTLCNACPDMHLSWVVQGRGWRGRNRTKQFDRDCLSAALHCRLHDALPCAHCAFYILHIVHIVHIVHYKALQCIAPGCILLLNIRLFVAAVHCLQVRGTLETEQKEGSLRAIVIVWEWLGKWRWSCGHSTGKIL